MNNRQLQYLRSMDIDVWQRRNLLDSNVAVQARQSERAAPVQDSAIRADEPEPFSTNVSAAAGVNATVAPMLESWSDVETAVRSCTLCSLHQARTQTVFGVGNRSARWMIIGEAPGADEDRQGEPFVGRAGQLLNSMLRSIGLPRAEVYIANILKCRPPNNRDPEPSESSSCTPYLSQQIELVEPRVLPAFGRIRE